MTKPGTGSELYQEAILEHYKNPQNFGPLDPCTFSHEGENPLCGDMLEIHVHLDEQEHIQAASFEGQGCAISQASTDIFLSNIQGETIQAVLEMTQDELLDALGVDVPNLRIKCAILPLLTVQDGALIHQGEKDPIDVTRTD